MTLIMKKRIGKAEQAEEKKAPNMRVAAMGAAAERGKAVQASICNFSAGDGAHEEGLPKKSIVAG